MKKKKRVKTLCFLVVIVSIISIFCFAEATPFTTVKLPTKEELEFLAMERRRKTIIMVIQIFVTGLLMISIIKAVIHKTLLSSETKKQSEGDAKLVKGQEKYNRLIKRIMVYFIIFIFTMIIVGIYVTTHPFSGKTEADFTEVHYRPTVLPEGYSEKASIEENKRVKYEEVGKKHATNYIKEKYGFEPNFTDCNLEYKINFYAPNEYTGNVFYRFERDGKEYSVMVSGEDDNVEGYDNYQQEEISNALLDAFENIAGVRPIGVFMGIGEHINRWTEDYLAYNLVGNYYDGNNLKEVVKEGNIIINYDENVMLKQIDWNDIQKVVSLSSVNIFTIKYKSNEEYQKYKSNEEYQAVMKKLSGNDEYNFSKEISWIRNEDEFYKKFFSQVEGSTSGYIACINGAISFSSSLEKEENVTKEDKDKILITDIKNTDINEVDKDNTNNVTSTSKNDDIRDTSNEISGNSDFGKRMKEKVR